VITSEDVWVTKSTLYGAVVVFRVTPAYP